MIAISNIELYNLLRAKLGEKEAQAVTSYIDTTVADKFIAEKQYLATKEDIAIVRKEIAETKADILKWLFLMFLPIYIGMIVFLIKQFI